jgi:hypothetical protein
MASAIEQENGANGASNQTTALAPMGMVNHETDSGAIAPYASTRNFESAQRAARALSSSTLVPKDYQGNIANCLLAMELASRIGASVPMVMQNLHIIQGRPSWSASFLVGSVNTCGRFTPIRYEIVGTDPFAKDYRVRAVAKDKASGDVLEGEWITWTMVMGEKWNEKPGSKWKTMPGQMFRYRAAAFWTRVYAPEISLGMHTAEEYEDITAYRPEPSGGARDLNAALRTIEPAALPASTNGLNEPLAPDNSPINDDDNEQRSAL